MQQVMNSFPDKRLHLFVIWLPSISTDRRNDALERSNQFPEDRVSYYWDSEKLTGKSMGFCFRIRHERLGYLLTLRLQIKTGIQKSQRQYFGRINYKELKKDLILIATNLSKKYKNLLHNSLRITHKTFQISDCRFQIEAD